MPRTKLGTLIRRMRESTRLQSAKAAHLDAPQTFTIADVRQVEASVKDTIAAIEHELSAPPPESFDTSEVRRFLLERDWLAERETDPAHFRAFLQHFIERVTVRGRGDYVIEWAGVMHQLA